MEPPPQPPRLDRRHRVTVPQCLRRRYLPRREGGLLLHRLVIRQDGVALLRPREAGPEPRLFRCLPVDMDQHVLKVRFLAPDSVHANAARDVADQPQPRSRLHGLLLARVAREHHLRPVALGELQDVMRLAGRQHPRLVHHDQGALSDFDLTLRRELQQLVHAVGPGVAVIAQRHRRAPGHGRRHDLVAVLPVEIGDRPQRSGLARARGPLDNRHTRAARGGEADCLRLFPAQRIALGQQGMNLFFHGLRRQAVAGVRRHGPGHVLHCLFEPEIVARRIDLGMGHAGPGFGRRLARLQPLDLRVAAQPLDCRPHRLPAHQSGGCVRRRLHHVRAPEYGFLPRQMGGQIVQPICQITYRLSRNIHLMAGHRGDQGLALDEGRGLFAPSPVSNLGVVVVRLAFTGQLVHTRHAGGVA